MTAIRTNPFQLGLASVDTSTDNKVKAYTPVWSSSANPQPVLGASTLTAWYSQRGDFCDVEITFIAGAGATFGTGVWQFSLPFTCGRGVNMGPAIGDHAGTNQVLVSAVGSGQSNAVIYSHNTTAQVGPSNPWVWVAGDFLVLNLSYPIR